MIEPGHTVLSITRQCALIGISRSAWYGTGKTESPLNLALMKLIDAQFMETPFYGSRQMARRLRNQGYCVGRIPLAAQASQTGSGATLATIERSSVS
ncbi:transposase [Rhodovulum sulfidophilum]|nr:transposase [Rhodovulum sulfidophilum]